MKGSSPLQLAVSAVSIALALVSIVLAAVSIALACNAIAESRKVASDTLGYLSEIRELSENIEYIATRIIDQQIAMLREKDEQLGRMIDEMSSEMHHLRESQQISDSLRADLDKRILELQEMKDELEGSPLRSLPEAFFDKIPETEPTPPPDSSDSLRQKLISPNSPLKK